MKCFNVLHLPVWSFFSADLYRDVALHWKGVCYGYLLLLLLMACIPDAVRLHKGYARFVAEEAPKLTGQIPPITIQNGKVSCGVPQPFVIREPGTDKPIVIIDTTGGSNLDNVEKGLLLTQDKLIYKESRFETRTYDLSSVQSFSLDGARITGWLQSARGWVGPVGYVSWVGVSYAYRIVETLLYALIGLAMAQALQTKLKYAALIRLSVLAITPVIVGGTILDLIGVPLPFAGWIYIAVAMGYLYFGVRAHSKAPLSLETIGRPPLPPTLPGLPTPPGPAPGGQARPPEPWEAP